MMQICSCCILPSTFPGITFNAEGVCNHCQAFQGRKGRLTDDKRRYEQKFRDLLDHVVTVSRSHPSADSNDRESGAVHRVASAPRSYDVLMAYSGGKDSTYTMNLLKRKYGLRVVALSFDNGFVSQRAVENIRNVTDSLGIDHIFFKAPWTLLRRVFLASSQRELYPRKALERASTICTSCMGLVKAICLKTAIEMNIPMIGYGWSPGQAPVQSSIMKNNPSLVRMAQQAILNPLREILGKDLDGYFLNEGHYANPDRFPYNVHPMAWEYYNEDMIREEIAALGWQAPDDTDSNSTNCLLNAYANEVHLQQCGFHPYVWEISNMVREGVMTREEGFKKIYTDQPSSLSDHAKEKLYAAN